MSPPAPKIELPESVQAKQPPPHGKDRWDFAVDGVETDGDALVVFVENGKSIGEASFGPSRGPR